MISIQEHDFDLAAEYANLREGSRSTGAVVAFVGLVRDLNEGDEVRRLFLEHYPGMTEKSILAIVEEAQQRWSIQGVRVIHRIGELQPADQIVLVACASAHRQDAFAAAEFIMDYLKTRAPFWKKELTADGNRWLETRQTDVEQAGRWNENP